jgi:hypothetical protein
MENYAERQFGQLSLPCQHESCLRFFASGKLIEILGDIPNEKVN